MLYKLIDTSRAEHKTAAPEHFVIYAGISHDMNRIGYFKVQKIRILLEQVRDLCLTGNLIHANGSQEFKFQMKFLVCIALHTGTAPAARTKVYPIVCQLFWKFDI